LGLNLGDNCFTGGGVFFVSYFFDYNSLPPFTHTHTTQTPNQSAGPDRHYNGLNTVKEDDLTKLFYLTKVSEEQSD